MDLTKPKIVISKCLEFDACRYDGKQLTNKHIKNLKKYIDFIPICPEVEIGMGIPRDTIDIIFTFVLTIKIKIDPTNKGNAGCRKRLLIIECFLSFQNNPD